MVRSGAVRYGHHGQVLNPACKRAGEKLLKTFQILTGLILNVPNSQRSAVN